MNSNNGYYVSKKFNQRKKRLFSMNNGLLSEKVNCLVFDTAENLFAGTADGLFMLVNDSFVPVFNDVLCGNINFIEILSDSTIAVGMNNKLYFIKNNSIEFIREFESDVVGINDKRNSLWILTKERFLGTDYACKSDFVNRPLEGGEGIDLAVSDNEIYVLTQTNISVIHGKRMEWKNILPQFSLMPECTINSISFDDVGYLWLGTDCGAAIHDNLNLWLTSEKIHTLPKNAIYKTVTDKVGGRYFASDIGVIYQNKGALKYFSAERWVPDNKINDIAVKADGSVFYAATDKGISEISVYETSLIEKANKYEEIIEKYHIRHGYTATRHVENYDWDGGYVNISDNDGSWTGLYVAAECFRYAVTGETDALEKARRGMKAMLYLMDITGLDGFTARAVRYPGENGFGDGNHEWVKTPDGKCEWKCETSSDEMTHHFFTLSVYYGICANEEEKEEISKHLCAITEHIIKNNFRLIDHDGLPTTWACWDPKMLNNNDKWFFERGINSLELLSFLKVSYHISGNEKYKKLYDSFVKDYHYPLNAMQHKIRDAHICHIDDNLGFVASMTLLRLEENEALRSLYLCGLEDHWEYERIEKQPFFCFIHAIFTGRDADLVEGIQSLREMPLDLTEYFMENSKRKDLIYDTEQEEWHEPAQVKYPLAFDERNIHRPDASVFRLDCAARNSVMDGTVFLLPYWIGRYYGLIEED
ncbi:MAG: hypothetical protein KBT46_03250 [Ruminococcus sp.]|nr:hypothetical protein [Candidatus Copronaster equi]